MTWTEGPTQGATHEHVFHRDGTVEWRDADTSGEARTGGAAEKGNETKERRAPRASTEPDTGSRLLSPRALPAGGSPSSMT